MKLKHVATDFLIGILGLYLPPSSYHYGQDAEGFFDSCASMWNDLSDCDLLVGAGDLNIRTKQLLDFIPVIDGNQILDFLKHTRSLILNGRITPKLNNFTFASSRGCSVPGYIFCPVSHLNYCHKMETLLMSDIVFSSGLDPPNFLPGHSFVKGTLITSLSMTVAPKPSVSKHFNTHPKRIKPNLSATGYNSFFLSTEVRNEVINTIRKIETISCNQQKVDTLWADIKKLFLRELKKLNQKARKSSKFWNDELEQLWRDVTDSEKAYLSFKVKSAFDHENKKQLRVI